MYTSPGNHLLNPTTHCYHSCSHCLVALPRSPVSTLMKVYSFPHDLCCWKRLGIQGRLLTWASYMGWLTWSHFGNISNSNVLPVIEVWCLLWLKLTFVAFYIFEGVCFHFWRKGIGGEAWSAELYVQTAKVFQQQSLPVYIRSSCTSARIMSCSFFLSLVGTDQWTNIEGYNPSSAGVWIGWFHLISFPFFKHSFIHSYNRCFLPMRESIDQSAIYGSWLSPSTMCPPRLEL